MIDPMPDPQPPRPPDEPPEPLPPRPEPPEPPFMAAAGGVSAVEDRSVLLMH